VSDLTLYIDRDTGSLEEWIEPEESVAGAHEWPADFGTYIVVLAAVDRAGNRSLPSEPVEIVIPAPDIPGQMADVTTTDLGTAIAVQWQRQQDAIAYQVWRANDAAGAGAATRGKPISALSYIDNVTDDAPGEATSAKSYWYKVQGVNLDGGGPLSPAWIQGTASGMSGEWVPFDSLWGNRIKAGSASFDIMEALLTVTQLLRTALTGSRWEIEGATGDAEAMQIRAYDLGGFLRWLLDVTGMRFLTDLGTDRLLLNKDGIAVYDATGAKLAELLGARVRVYGNDQARHISLTRYGGTDLSNDVALVASDGSFTLAPSVGSSFRTDAAPFSIGDNSYAIGILFNRVVRGASRVRQISIPAAGIVFDDTAADGTPGEYFAIYPDGRIAWGTGGADPVAMLRRLNDRFGNAFTLWLDQFGGANRANLIAGDIHSFRPANNAHGIVWFGNGSIADAYCYFNGGAYVFPNFNLVVNGVTVSSSREVKRSIRAANLDLAKARQLRARKFRWRDDPTDAPERLGFVAEEVVEAIPDAAVIGLGDGPDGAAVGGGVGYSLEGVVAAQQEALLDLADQLATAASAAQTAQDRAATLGEQLATATARVATLEGQVAAIAGLEQRLAALERGRPR
jgi:hypothetical protein